MIGATSFADLRTVNGTTYNTYREACIALGLLQDDNEWIQCLTEAAAMQVGSALRTLFATILLHCHPTSPGELWQRFRHQICDDLHHKLQTIYPNQQFSQDEIYMYGLYLLDQILRRSNREIGQFAGMPAVTGNWQVDVPENRLLQAQRDYDVDDLAARVTHNVQLFNVQQQQVYDAAMDSINHSRGQLLFIQSAGGCGKTFVCNTIAAAVRAQGKIALCVASSGIAALLLEGGRTAHSTFRIPIQLDEASTCSIARGSETHQVLEQTAVIIWDEVPMQHKHAIDAVDRTLRDLL
jgi:hypothetical protein